jgi:hypothetical protein
MAATKEMNVAKTGISGRTLMGLSGKEWKGS